jgi:mono/diheme cytochrome c family protein
VKILRWLVGVLVVVIVCAAAGLAVYFYALNPKVAPAPAVAAPRTPEALARGKYLAENVIACMSCHSQGEEGKPGDPTRPGMVGSGRDFGPMEGFLGRVRAPNLTPDPRAGVADWSDGQLMRAIREGVDLNGRTLFPMMPYATYGRLLSDEDTLAIIAYLRALAPVAHDPGPMEVSFPVSMFVRAAPRPVEKPAGPPPPASDAVARGAWLLEAASCVDCHSTLDNGRPREGMRLAGNTIAFEAPGIKVYAPNLTADKATGIGAWSDEDILRVLSDGIGKDGKPIYVMPWPYYKGMTEEDKRAIVAALRQVPAVSHTVGASTKPGT